MTKEYERSGIAPKQETRWWVVGLVLFSLLPQGLAVQISGRTPNVLAFDLVLLVLLAWVLFELFVGDLKFHPADGWTTNLIVALILCQVLSLLLNEQGVLKGLYSIKVSLFGYLPYLLTSLLVRTNLDFRRATYSLVIWGGVIGLLLTFYFFTGGFADMGPAASYDAKDEVGIAMGRNNYLAAILILVLPIGFAIMWSHRGPRRLLFSVPVALMGLGLLITMSKGAFIALAAGSIAAIPLMRKQGLRLRHVIIFLLLISAFLVVVPRDLILSIVDMFSYRLANPDLERIDLLRVAWQAFKNHPFFGVGPSAIYLYNKQFAIDVVDTHNFVLQELAEVGIIGAIPFFIILGTFVRRTYRLCTSAASDVSLRFLPLGLFVGLVSTLAHGLVEPTFPGQQYAVVFWVCMGLVFILTSKQLENHKVAPQRAEELARGMAGDVLPPGQNLGAV